VKSRLRNRLKKVRRRRRLKVLMKAQCHSQAWMVSPLKPVLYLKKKRSKKSQLRMTLKMTRTK